MPKIFKRLPDGGIAGFDDVTHKCYEVILKEKPLRSFSDENIIALAPLIAGVEKGIPLIEPDDQKQENTL